MQTQPLANAVATQADLRYNHFQEDCHEVDVRSIQLPHPKAKEKPVPYQQQNPKAREVSNSGKLVRKLSHGEIVNFDLFNESWYNDDYYNYLESQKQMK